MNNEQLIKNLINMGENEQLEFSQVVHKEDIAKTICAFLNGEGGTILLGVRDNGKITGIDKAEEHETELKQFLFQSIIPEAPISVTTETVGSKKIIFIKVWIGSKPPYIYNGEIFFRRNDKTVVASSSEISKLIIERQHTELHWERKLVVGAEIADLDSLEIRNTIQHLSNYGRGKLFGEHEVEEFLTYYGLYRNSYLTNAAIVLFAKEPTRFLPQCRVRLTVFGNNKISNSYNYDKIYEGNLFQNIKDILQFFDVNIATKSRFSEREWQREDITFPKFALREGLMNAMIHRDFSDSASIVHIAFYPTHLEIINSGILSGGYSPSDLIKNHLSIPRNPDIAHICFIRQMIEKIGRGTILMIEDCKNKGYAVPKWESDFNYTTVSFPGVTITSKDDTVSDAISNAVNDAVNDAVKGGIIDAVSDTVIDALIDTVNAIVKSDNGINMKDVMAATGKSNATAKRYLQILRTIDLIVFEGATRTGKYQLTNQAKNKIKI